ncbi:pyruvate, phosphate dikinase [bacterium]|nr:pyruvate, phosphate dikinase [bacterium]
MTLVYYFGQGKADGNAKMKAELGGKGANLAEMTSLGLPVPAGFTIATEVCMDFLENGEKYPASLEAEVAEALAKIEAAMGARFGSKESPLLVSVRSGARVSMPGMMDTILNLGLNDVVVEALARNSDNPRFAFDSYRRFIQMFANVVKGLDAHVLEDALENLKQHRGVIDDTDLNAQDLKHLVEDFKGIYSRELGEEFPQDPQKQLWAAIGAVFRSWNCNRANKYREIHGIPNNWGTAVNVCAMVFGNMGETSATGVCFTRDPSTGENVFYGEYLVNAQGEDVVAGIRTPKTLSLLQNEMPGVYEQLNGVRLSLERHYRDVQDIEFTVQDGRLWLLQTRNAKRTTQAALKIAVDMVHEGLLSRKEAIARVKPNELEKLLHPTLDPRAHRQVIAKGLPASPGACSGRVVFDSKEAEQWAARGEAIILVRDETSPEDIAGMHVSKGFLTARGGMTSHAAVVARQMGKSCIAGCGALQIFAKDRFFKVGKLEVFEGDWLTLDGSSGEVMLGKVNTREAELSSEFSTFLAWAKALGVMNVRANADTPRDARAAREFGAEGIGLCRTEHMFFDEARLPVVREMILAQNNQERARALAKLLPFQRQDFVEILKAMQGFPVTIRLLDPPLHEFLPQTERDIHNLSTQIGMSVDEIRLRVSQLHEANPMLGHRGCRLGISHPEIYEMQVCAIAEATAQLHSEGVDAQPEVMIPLVGHAQELKWLRDRLEILSAETYKSASAALNAKPKTEGIPFGTMIEVPRAALTANQIAEHADFFSFGTNDLTQTTFGFSRDDSAPFLKVYARENILKDDPFAVVDQEGVGQLIQWAAEKGRARKPTLKVGVCGEHGGDPKSIEFFNQVGVNYVSCSPYRVPVAILSSAQAALQ